MLIVHSLADLRAALSGSHKPAFVATMGNLHQGHLDLVQQARALGDMTVASIFVNRLQFAPHEDFDSYPRTLSEDVAQLKATGCQVLFAPAEAELYPQAQTFKVRPDPALADILEGHFRPGFFTGVCTVVMKLFQAVFAGKAAGVALFGMKDYQQQLVIRHMVRQFALPIEIVTAATRRADDGLALSSRNGYLSAEHRIEAVALSRALQQLALQARQNGAEALPALEAQALQALNARGWQSDYLTVRRRTDLLAPEGALADQALVALGAARLGKTRLIDNLEF
jgi:pantoate--beta-alanine ligase